MNTAAASGTCAIASPAVCAGPSSISSTTRSPTRSSRRPVNDSVGRRGVMPSKSNRRIVRCANASNSGPRSSWLNSAWTSCGPTASISSSAAAVATIGIPSGSSSLPNQWSPLPCVFIACSIGWRSVIGLIVSSSARVRGRSNSVSTSSDVPSPVISPALLQPQPPSGCSYAYRPSPSSCSFRKLEFMF